ncbi:putative membrane-associated kinase regulator 2 [Acorus gramineus]|uniref:Membrane-associated kinase regulator 2 n=1 Tax=Acorus gramineus TaxID=55184 RepID=A0AAV9BE14_ACOGR|nr:putative membrane-associated kinase regulator 2 [Acorus gramineus]
MEAFSLLKYWRGGDGASHPPSSNSRTPNPNPNPIPTTTVATTVLRSAEETDDEADPDEGPFFDLEFAVPDDEDDDEEDDGGDDGDSDDEGSRGFGFTVSSAASEGGRTDPDADLSLSPSDDLFFKGRLQLPLESSSIVFNNNNNNNKPQFPVSLIKSATKFRVFMLGLKKPRPPPPPSPVAAPEACGATPAAQKSSPHQNGKFFTVKFKVEEVPIVSLFTRDHSSRSTGSNRGQKPPPPPPPEDPTATTTADDKRFAKDVMQKYLKMIKPLYVKASKRYGDKPRFSAHLTTARNAKAPSPPSATETTEEQSTEAGGEAEVVVVKEAAEAPAATAEQRTSGNKRSLKQVSLQARLRVVGKQLGKSRSASSAVAAAPSPAVVARRRDDSLLQQQDGIQSAIAHCKRSFNASSSESGSPLLRCKSESSDDRSMEPPPSEEEDGKVISCG